jgi:flavin-dependent dehydrogenase
MTMRLRDGSRVCIIGGGPAASFAALHLCKLAQEHGLRLEVLVFEPRDYARPGRTSCKGCAGILSADMVRSLDALGLDLPKEIIQAELRAYVLHVYGQVTSIEQPNPQRQILSVYRGAGPHHHQGDPPASFDGYLLSQAIAHGAQRIHHRVRSVEWDDGPVIETAHASYRADFVVLATGVNSRAALSPAFGYQPPQTAVMMQDEILRPDNWPDYKVAGFFGQPPGLAFGAMVPKGRYLNVSLLVKDAAPDTVRRFYLAQDQALGRFFSTPPESLCCCTARITVGPAKVFFGDRWVAVGDAAVSRLYKDGIYSAFLTAGTAMRAAVERGIAREDFARAYAPFCRSLARDNLYGKLLFDLSLRAMQNSILARACVERIRAEASLEVSRRTFSRLMWGMVTGDESYRDLFWLVLNPKTMMQFAREALRVATRQVEWR